MNLAYHNPILALSSKCGLHHPNQEVRPMDQKAHKYVYIKGQILEVIYTVKCHLLFLLPYTVSFGLSIGVFL